MATWMDLFWDAILGRGMKITFDKITSIEQNADAIVATVVGTEPYTVTIKKDFSEMSCTCPCEGYYCKHMVAVLRFLEQDEKLREILANFADSELGKRAVSFEQQRIAANAKAEEQRAREIERAIKYQEYLKNLPQILKEREEKRKQAEEEKRIAEEKRKERERKLQEEYEAAEKRRKELAKQERERRKQQKEEAARRQAEFERIQAENAKRFEEEKIAREAEEQKQKNIAELKRLEAEQKAEEARQRRLDRQAARNRPKLQKKYKAEYERDDEMLRQMEELEKEQMGDTSRPYKPDVENAWYYPDEDYGEGTTYIDPDDGTEVFVPDGYSFYKVR